MRNHFLRAATAKGSATDPYFANVFLLLHGNGTNGSTTITDSSPSPKAIEVLGDAKISTAQSMFGGSSILFDGVGDQLRIAAPLVAANASTFTIETYIYLVSSGTSASSVSGLTSIDADDTDADYFSWGPLTDRKLCLRWFDGANKSVTASTVLNLGQQYHIAVSVLNNAIKMFVEGVDQTLTGTTTLTNRSGTTNKSRIGSSFYAAMNGYIDEFRVTRDVARYTTSFTPPTAPFPDA